ncbi:hypothetical protein NBRC116494_06110 [Aurantivibrio plasticivorans]
MSEHTGTAVTGKELRLRRQVHFLSRDEAEYPQLTRLCLDFDFHVLLVDNFAEPNIQQYILSRTAPQVAINPITPAFPSLQSLERYTNAKVLDILKQTVFSSDS